MIRLNDIQNMGRAEANPAFVSFTSRTFISDARNSMLGHVLPHHPAECLRNLIAAVASALELGMPVENIGVSTSQPRFKFAEYFGFLGQSGA